MSERHAGIDDATRLLERAQEAVNRGDPVKMLEELAASRYLDGLTRRLQKRWGDSLPSEEVDECIAQAVDAACAAAYKGRRVLNLPAWLWKAAKNIANDRWRADYKHREDIDTAEFRAAMGSARELMERQARRQARRGEAIRIGRELLPRIGQGQVVDVMEVVIDAIENGVPDLPTSSVAELVGISEDAARTLMSRGFKRLRRLAEQEGVRVPMDLPDTDTDDNG